MYVIDMRGNDPYDFSLIIREADREAWIRCAKMCPRNLVCVCRFES